MDRSEEVTEARRPHRAAEVGSPSRQGHRHPVSTDPPSSPQPYTAATRDQGPTGVYTPPMLSSQALLTTTCWADHRAHQPAGEAHCLPAGQGQSAQHTVTSGLDPTHHPPPGEGQAQGDSCSAVMELTCHPPQLHQPPASCPGEHRSVSPSRLAKAGTCSKLGY